MVDFNINLLSRSKMLHKQYYDSYSRALLLIKKYISYKVFISNPGSQGFFHVKSGNIKSLHVIHV